MGVQIPRVSRFPGVQELPTRKVGVQIPSVGVQIARINFVGVQIRSRFLLRGCPDPRPGQASADSYFVGVQIPVPSSGLGTDSTKIGVALILGAGHHHLRHTKTIQTRPHGSVTAQ